jgi:hypothetical protein
MDTLELLNNGNFGEGGRHWTPSYDGGVCTIRYGGAVSQAVTIPVEPQSYKLSFNVSTTDGQGAIELKALPSGKQATASIKSGGKFELSLDTQTGDDTLLVTLRVAAGTLVFDEGSLKREIPAEKEVLVPEVTISKVPHADEEPDSCDIKEVVTSREAAILDYEKVIPNLIEVIPPENR